MNDFEAEKLETVALALNELQGYQDGKAAQARLMSIKRGNAKNDGETASKASDKLEKIKVDKFLKDGLMNLTSQILMLYVYMDAIEAETKAKNSTTEVKQTWIDKFNENCKKIEQKFNKTIQNV